MGVETLNMQLVHKVPTPGPRDGPESGKITVVGISKCGNVNDNPTEGCPETSNGRAFRTRTAVFRSVSSEIVAGRVLGVHVLWRLEILLEINVCRRLLFVATYSPPFPLLACYLRRNNGNNRDIEARSTRWFEGKAPEFDKCKTPVDGGNHIIETKDQHVCAAPTIETNDQHVCAAPTIKTKTRHVRAAPTVEQTREATSVPAA
jgi:hypothetical protein